MKPVSSSDYPSLRGLLMRAGPAAEPLLREHFPATVTALGTMLTIAREAPARSAALTEETQVVWAAVPGPRTLRPGDRVFGSYEQARRLCRAGQRPLALTVDAADLSDVGSFYMPAWARKRLCAADGVTALLSESSPAHLRLLLLGEAASLIQFEREINRVRETVRAMDFAAQSDLHGTEHWGRVEMHAVMLARASGVDPLVPVLFALVHDCRRRDDGIDPGHGKRAAEFVRSERTGLFGFLDDAQVALLQSACKHHSDGHTQGPPEVQCCWDADRLDLWRCGVEPEPRYLCTPYAREEAVIRRALQWVNDAQPEPTWSA